MQTNRSLTRLEGLDALRGTAAVMVVFQHMLDITAGFPKMLYYIDLGRLGVSSFFLISGFVVPFSIGGSSPLRRFALSRAFRLIPALWLSVAVMVVIQGGAPLARIASDMLMMSALSGTGSVSPVYWTLTFELIFYAICAALYAMRMLDRPRVIFTIALVLVGLAALRGDEVLLVVSLMPIGLLIRLQRGEQISSNVLPVLALILFEAAILTLPHPRGGYAAAMALAPCLFFAALRVRKVPRGLIHMGAISYSVYLFHPAAIDLLKSAPQSLFILGVTLATIGIATVVWQFVERPMISLGRRISVSLGSETEAVRAFI